MEDTPSLKVKKKIELEQYNRDLNRTDELPGKEEILKVRSQESLVIEFKQELEALHLLEVGKVESLIDFIELRYMPIVKSGTSIAGSRITYTDMMPLKELKKSYLIEEFVYQFAIEAEVDMLNDETTKVIRRSAVREVDKNFLDNGSSWSYESFDFVQGKSVIPVSLYEDLNRLKRGYNKKGISGLFINSDEKLKQARILVLNALLQVDKCVESYRAYSKLYNENSEKIACYSRLKNRVKVELEEMRKKFNMYITRCSGEQIIDDIHSGFLDKVQLNEVKVIIKEVIEDLSEPFDRTRDWKEKFIMIDLYERRNGK